MPETIDMIRETIKIPPACRERFLPLSAPCCHTLQDEGIDLAGVSELRKGYLVDRREYALHLILYTVGGAGRLETPDETRVLGHGDVLVAPKGTSYCYRVAESPWQIVWFHAHDRGLWRALAGRRLHVHPSYQAEPLHRAMKGVLDESIRSDVGAERLATLFGDQVWVYLQRELAAGTGPDDRRVRAALQELWAHVSTHLDVQWSVDSLADRLNISPPHLHRLAERCDGCSPMRTVFRLRMRRAEDLLINRDYPLKIVADMVGYSTPYAFSNAFKRWKGISPGRFRSSHSGSTSQSP